MRFSVPQFIEHQAKIIGPFTFNQFIYIGIAGGACFILYFILPFPFFIASCVILIGGALAIVFLKINGRSLPAVFGSFLKFSIMPKMYIWKKKNLPVTKVTIIANKEKKKEKELSLKIAGDSKIKEIKSKIENK